MPPNRTPDFVGFLHSGDSEKLMNEDVMQKLHRYWVLAGLEQSRDSLQKTQGLNPSDKREYKRQLNYLRRQIFVHYLKNTFFFPIWLIKILTPSFFKGTPNIWTNIKIIASNKEFHPLRMAMVSWLVFSYLIIQGGVFLFRYAPKTEAASYTWTQSGWVTSSTVSLTDTANRASLGTWTNYWDVYPYSANTPTMVTTTGSEITLAVMASSTVDTVDDHFDGGTYSSTESNGSGGVILTSSAGYYGSGADGAITLTSFNNLNTTNVATGRSCADGGDSVVYNVSSVTDSDTVVLTSTPSANCLVANDTVLLINMQGTTSNQGNVGNHEILTVSSVSGTTVNFTASKTKYYGTATSTNDLNIGTTSSNQKVVLQRIPQYTNVTLDSGGSITASAWNGLKGGIVAFYASGAVTINSGGMVSSTELGYRGGGIPGVGNLNGETIGYWTIGGRFFGGGSTEGTGVFGCGSSYGGGYGTAGAGFIGGGVYGDVNLSQLFFGSGAGYISEEGGTTYRGTSGGGIVYILGSTVTVNTGGSIVADAGSPGVNSYRSRGAGGSVKIVADTLSLGTNLVTAITGTTGGSISCGSDYGENVSYAGGSGRIHLESNSISGTTNPTADTDSLSTTYSASGTIVSRIIDTSSTTAYGTLSWSATTPANTTVTMKVRTSMRSDMSGATDWATCDAVTSGDDISANNCVTDGYRYIQYQATLATTDTSATPTLSDVTINYSQYYLTEQTITSSPFDSENSANVISRIAWTETLPAGTDIKYQIRTSADNDTWTSWLGPTNGSDYYTASNGSETINSTHTNGLSDRYFQYKIFVSTTNGSNTPTLSDVTVTYVVNDPPEFSYSGHPESVVQNSDGTVTIVFGVRDPDFSTDADGLASSTFQYSLNNGSSWSSVVSNVSESGYASASTSRALHSTNWATSTVIWTPKNEIDGQAVSQALIKITADDGEAANRTSSSVSAVFTIDVKDPTLGSPAIRVVATTTPATIYNFITDDNSLEMSHSLNSDMSGASWEAFAATKTVTLASDPDVVYARFRDSYSNTTAIQSATTPETPTNIVIRDLSNVNTSDYKLFIAWSTVAVGSPAFARYDIWRSTDGSTYTLLDTQTTRTTNYYLDATVTANTTYYYKIATVNANGSTSYYSSAVSDNADGQGGTDATAPSITSVATSAVTTQGFTVTWNTDEVSSSSVAYVANAFSGSFTTSTLNTMVDSSTGLVGDAHSITITGLTPNTTYYFYVGSADPTGNRSFSNNSNSGYSVTTLDGPTITNVTVDSVDNSQATITWTTNSSSDSTVYYSTNSTLSGASNSTSATLTTTHSITLTGLTQGTTYYFYVTSSNATNNNSGSYYSFTTSNDSTGPTIAAQSASNIGDDTAVITWSTSEGGTSQVRYGTASGSLGTYTSLVTNYNTNHSVSLSSLTVNTTYYYTVSSVDASRNPTTSTEGNFTTLNTLTETVTDSTAPTISSISASPVADTTAVVNWTTNETATSRVSYGTTSGSLTSQTTLNANLNTTHAELVSGLTADTTYYYTVSSVDSSGNSTTSSQSSFVTLETLSEESAVAAREAAAQAVGQAAGQVTGAASAGGGGGFPYVPPATPLDTTPPAITNVNASDIKSEIATVAWTTSEAGDSIVEFGKDIKYGSAFVNLSNTTNQHSITLSGLDPSTLYNYKVSTSDKSGNRSFSANQTFTTVSAFEEIDTLQELGTDDLPEEPAEVTFKSLIEKTAELIKKMSGQVSVDTLESGLATQYATIRDLGKLVPLPLIGGQPVVEVGASYARIFWTTDKASNSLVAIAPDSTFQNNKEYTQVVGNASEAVENHEVVISELKPSTVYHYQVRSKTQVSDTAKSRDFTFTTKEQQVEISTYKMVNISPESTSFSWATNVPTDSKVTYIPYGQDGALQIDSARSVFDKNVTTIHDITVKDLEAGQVYQVELSGKDNTGAIVSKTISTFSTSEVDLPPVISQVQTDAALLPGEDTSVQAIISWITNEPTTSQIFYQKGFAKVEETTEFSKKTPLDPNYVKRHVIVITDFEPGSVYQFQVESVDSSGNATRSRTFTLLSPRQKESVFQVIMNNIEETFSWVGQLGL